MTVSDLLRRMSSQEFSEWWELEQIDHVILEAERADLRAAIGTAVLANLHRGSGHRAFEVTDFVPFRQRPREMTEEERFQAAQVVATEISTWARRHNAAVGA